MAEIVPGLGHGAGLDLPVDGVLPPDLEGTFLRIGPGNGESPGTLHAIELREGKAVSYRQRDSAAWANVLWHAGAVLALPEAGVPLQYSRALEPEEFTGGLQVKVASHLRREAASGRRTLFGVEQGEDSTTLRLGEWGRDGSLASAQSVALERATWQHDAAVTGRKVVFVESPTEPLGTDDDSVAVPFRWVPGTEGWLGVVRRADGVVEEAATTWTRVDPCLVTHMMGAFDTGGGGGGGEPDGVVLYPCVYPAPEKGQPIDTEGSVVGPLGVGRSLIGGGLGVLEQWRVAGGGGRVERKVVDERFVEYPRVDAFCEGAAFRYGYCVELDLAHGSAALLGGDVVPVGLLRFDITREEAVAWNPGEGRAASEPVFVRAVDGRADDEGWLLTVVDDAVEGESLLYVLDASSFGRRPPQAVVHLPDGIRLPFRSHGEWVGAAQYR